MKRSTPNNSPSIATTFAVSLCCLSLSGCLSTAIDNLNPLTPPDPTQRTALYNETKDLWSQAAARPNDLFNRYNFRVYASIDWQKRSDASSYALTKIKIGQQGDQYRINLLYPQFDGKMACGWYCEFLDQPIIQPVLGPYTMLDKVFAGQNQSLLNFYDSLRRLNDRLLTLKPDYLHLIPDFIAQLAVMEQTFDSLEHVIGFLNDYFDDIDFQAEFEAKQGVDGLLVLAADQPTADPIDIDAAPGQPAATANGADAQSVELYRRANEYKNVVGPATARAINPELAVYLDTPNPDKALLASFQAAPPVLMDFEQPAAMGQTDQGSNQGNSSAQPPAPASSSDSVQNSAKNSPQNDPQNSAPDNSLWTSLSQQNITIGQLVCSYQENFFGDVIAINEQTATIQLKGQAKELKDGLFVNASAGVLFRTDAEFSYLQSEDRKDLPLHQIAPCFLSGF